MIEPRLVPRKRLCFVTAMPLTLNVFMRAHIETLRQNYEVTLVSSGSAADLAGLLDGHVVFIPVQIVRKISVVSDILALIALWKLFRKEKFDGVHSVTPKAGLLSMLAARLAGIPLRLHTFTGQVWATQRGFRRFLLKFLDKVLVFNATQIFADSRSQRLFLIKNNVVKAAAIEVLAEGSIAGVDIDKFKYNSIARARLRSSNKIPADAVVLLFMGRLTRDKGLVDLSRAFALAAEENTRLHLLIVGPDEEGLEVELSLLAKRFLGRVHRFGYTDHPQDYISMSDVFCLPSYREGFGTVLIEAAAVGLPAIASRIYGIVDAVEDGVTGILHQPASSNTIAKAMLLLASDDRLRTQMGIAARKRAIGKFSEARVTRALSDFYERMFSKTISSFR